MKAKIVILLTMLASALCLHAQCCNKGDKCDKNATSLAGKMCTTTIHSKIAGSKMSMTVKFTDCDSCELTLAGEELRTEYGAKALIVHIFSIPAHYTLKDNHLTLDYNTAKASMKFTYPVLDKVDDQQMKYIQGKLRHEGESAEKQLTESHIKLLLPQMTAMTLQSVTDNKVELELDNTPSRFPDMEGSRIRH